MQEFRLGYLVNALVYASFGLLLFCAAFAIIDKFTPYHLWDEIVKERNTALAILIGALSIGMSIIIASAVH